MANDTEGENKIQAENHYNIQKAYWDHIKDHDKLPTLDHLAEITGLTTRTISNHIKEIRKQDFSERYENLSIMTDEVILGLFKRARGDGQAANKAAEVYLEVVEGIKKTSNVNHYFGKYGEMTPEELKKENTKMGEILADHDESGPAAGA